MVKTVIIICVAIVLWAGALGVGYDIGNTAGWRDGIGRAKQYITNEEMKAYKNGYDLGFFAGKRARGSMDVAVDTDVISIDVNSFTIKCLEFAGPEGQVWHLEQADEDEDEDE